MNQRWATAGLVAALLAVGAVSWQLQLQRDLKLDAARLAELPISIGSWRGREVPIESGVEQMLAADFNVQRAYFDPMGGLVWFYVGYYGTDRGGRPEHTPWVCYPSNGWSILEQGVVDVNPEEGLRANEIIVEKDGQLRLVHFWYQSYRKAGMLGGFDQALHRVASRVLDGRADGSLVRLSTSIEDPAEATTARSRLIAFGREVAPLLTRYWPEERAHSDH